MSQAISVPLLWITNVLIILPNLFLGCLFKLIWVNFLNQAPHHHSPPQRPSCLPFALRLLGLIGFMRPHGTWYLLTLPALFLLHFTQSFHFLEGSIVSVSFRPLCAVPSSILYTLPSSKNTPICTPALNFPQCWKAGEKPLPLLHQACPSHGWSLPGHTPLCSLMGSVGGGHITSHSF